MESLQRIHSSSSSLPSAVDTLVVGGGPAGVAAALEIHRRGSAGSTLLVDAGDYGGFRVGESVPPTVQTLLDQLGAGGLLNDELALPCHGTGSAWAGDELEFHDYITGLSGDGWHLDRCRFDAAFAGVAEKAGVTTETNLRLVHLEPSAAERWRGTMLDKHGVEHVVDAGFIVDATGRRAAVARKLGARWQRFDGLIAVVARYAITENIPHRVTIEARPSGWWYAAPLPGDSVVVAWLSDADLVRGEGMHRSATWEKAVRDTRHISTLISSAVSSSEQSVHPAGSWLLEPAHGHGWVATGDACACFDPLSSVGIVESLRSGIGSADAVDRWLNGDRDALANHIAMRRLDFENYLVARDRVYSSAERFGDSPFWRRRSGAIALDPRSPVTLPSGGGAALKKAVGSRLTRDELSIVANLSAEGPCPAHDLVSELRTRGGWQRSHQRLILGVQQLVESGLLE